MIVLPAASETPEITPTLTPDEPAPSVTPEPTVTVTPTPKITPAPEDEEKVPETPGWSYSLYFAQR